MEKYQEVRKSLQDLVKNQERNIAQLERIGAVVEQRWGSKEDLWDYRKEREIEKDRDEEEGSKNSPRESQEEGTPLSASC